MDAVEACDVSLEYSMVVMATWCSARVTDDADVVAVVGGTRFPLPYTNAIFPRSSLSADELFDRADGIFTDRRYFAWSRGRGPSIRERGAERGHTPLPDLPGMVATSRVLPPLPAVDAHVLAPDATSEFDECVSVLGAAYSEEGLPPQITPLILADARRALSSATFALARVDGKPAAAAISITDPETRVGGLYWVGATPSARRRGAGDAVTRLVTNAAFDQGADIVTLQASPQGALVYPRMGYREVCRYERTLSPKREKVRP